MSVKKRFPKKPFEFGRYIIEYREKQGDVLRFLKERLDTFDEAKAARDKLLSKGCSEPVIKKVG
tara:strand:+ start:147 stop:338 length:192 start_codon:yes stop_codon:yes gene_type:complete